MIHHRQTHNQSADNDSQPENIQIYLRLKPHLKNPDGQPLLQRLDDQRVQVTSPYYVENERHFHYDYVFDRTMSNNDIFDKAMLPLVHNAIGGMNSTMLICGMTGSGKTYTMFGSGQGIKDRSPLPMTIQQSEGVVWLTLTRLFEEIKNQANIKTKVNLSFFEIYNETIKDLLRQDGQNLNVVEDPQRGTIISQLSEISISNETTAREILRQGFERRANSATNINELSSRSHAIVQLQLKRYKVAEKEPQKTTIVQQSKLFMVDLAGNEKSHSNSLNKRFIEGVNINKSLLTLGKCIKILAEKKNQFVPFRDSKLTRILKESLGGNSKTVMIACVSSERQHYEQTLNTLKFSSIAKGVRNKTMKNLRQVSLTDLEIQPLNERKQEINKMSSKSLPKESSKPQLLEVPSPSDRNIFDLLSKLVTNIQKKFKAQSIIKKLSDARQHIPSEDKQLMTSVSQSLRQLQEEKSRIFQQGQRNYNTLLKLLTQHDRKGNEQLHATISKQKNQIDALLEQKQMMQKQLQRYRHSHQTSQNIESDSKNMRLALDQKKPKIRKNEQLSMNNSIRTTNRSDYDENTVQNRPITQSFHHIPVQKELVIDLAEKNCSNLSVPAGDQNRKNPKTKMMNSDFLNKSPNNSLHLNSKQPSRHNLGQQHNLLGISTNDKITRNKSLSAERIVSKSKNKLLSTTKMKY